MVKRTQLRNLNELGEKRKSQLTAEIETLSTPRSLPELDRNSRLVNQWFVPSQVCTASGTPSPSRVKMNRSNGAPTSERQRLQPRQKCSCSTISKYDVQQLNHKSQQKNTDHIRRKHQCSYKRICFNVLFITRIC